MILPIVLLIMPQRIRCCEQHLMVVGFFLTFSPILDLGHFSQVILPIVLQIMPNHQVLFTASEGYGSFLTCSPILDSGLFSQVIFPIVLQIMPSPKISQTIRCCPQHLMVWANFFFELFSLSGLRAFFTSDFTNCTTDYAPSIRCCSQHLMVGGFCFTCSPILDWGHFSQMILPIVLQFMPNHQVLFRAFDGWGYFFLTCSPILDLGHFSQVILPIVLQIMPQPKNNPNHQVLWTASDGWG